MPTTQNGGTYYVIPHEKDESPQELVQRISKSEQEQRKRERAKKDKEINEWKKNNIIRGDDATTTTTPPAAPVEPLLEGREGEASIQETEAQAAFRCAHFICSPPGTVKKTVIPRNEFSAGEIEAHQASCEYCIQKREERKQEEQLQMEGPLQMRYTIHAIKSAQDDISSAKTKIEEQKRRADLQGWERDWIIRDLRIRELEPAQFKLTQEQAELKKLLKHPNPIIREGALEEYQKYLERRKKKNSFHQS